MDTKQQTKTSLAELTRAQAIVVDKVEQLKAAGMMNIKPRAEAALAATTELIKLQNELLNAHALNHELTLQTHVGLLERVKMLETKFATLKPSAVQG